MTKRQASANGYVFLGAYSHNKEEMKERAKRERAKGNKAVVVNVPPSKYSRGSRGMGYSVYFIESEANKKKRTRENLELKIAGKKLELDRLINEAYEIRIKLEELEIELEGIN
jgi:hypothetical protein